MRNSKLITTLCLMSSFALMNSALSADAPPGAKPATETRPTGNVGEQIANGQTIYNEGKGEAAACMGCHGEKALGNDAMGSPRLANLGYAYVQKQLNDFAADRRTPSGVGAAMNGFAKALSERDRSDVATYLNTLEMASEPSDLKALAADGQKVGQPELGKVIVTDGIQGRIPACQACHGFNGRDPRFPKINQQRYVYLVNQLNSWRDGSRANDPVVEQQGIMRRIAEKLTDDDIINIAAFLSTSASTSPAGEAAQ
jgi:cytochrome c553